MASDGLVQRTRSFISGEFARFVIVRGICTVVSYGLYLLLLLLTRYEVAYVVSYAGGVVLAYFVSSRYVFRVPMSARSAARFPLVYVAQFLATFVLLRAAVSWGHISPSIAYILAVGITIPLTFALSRRIMRAG